MVYVLCVCQSVFFVRVHVCVYMCVGGWVCLIAVKADRVRFWHIKKK